MTLNPGSQISKFLTKCPIQFTNLPSALGSCNHTSEIHQIHGYIIKNGHHNDSFLLSKLIASSIKDTQYAASIFNQISHPNLFMYNTMLRAYSISDNPKQGFGIFNNLRAAEGIILDQFSFVSILKSCTRESATMMGQSIHGVAVRSGHVNFVNVKNTLLHFYGACGGIHHAQKLFDESPQRNDLVSWNSLMGGYLHVSRPRVVIDLFKQMLGRCLSVSVATMLTVLPAACGLVDSLGESLHVHCIKIGFCSDSKLLSALVDMYAKSGNIDSGRHIFYSISKKDVVLWNCMIGNYAKRGLIEESLALLQLMEYEEVKPNSSTLVSILSACAASGAKNVGLRISNYVEEHRLPSNVVIDTALVDMYAKCGLLDKAVGIFERMENKDVKSWTAMISGHGVHGRAKDAIAVFDRMVEEGCRPNEVTFLAVLSACSHRGLVFEGMKCFERMVTEYGISPKIEHYGCVIDLFGRAGLLEEAYDLIESLPIKSDAIAWRALLSACRVHGNVRLGERVQQVLVGFGEEHPTDSILLSSTYAIAGWLPDQARWLETKEMFKEIEDRSSQKDIEMIKEAGYSTIEIDGEESEQGL